MRGKLLKNVISPLPRLYRPKRYYSQLGYFSPSYRCDEAWEQRLKHPPLQSIRPVDFYYDIDHKYRTVQKMFALDADLLFNKLTKADFNNFLEEVQFITQRLRQSPDTIYTLPSTNYAFMRMLLEFDHKDVILKVISAPDKYGIFPETHIWNLLYDTYLNKKEYTVCARLAAACMLQEDFCSTSTLHLSMLSCLQWAFNGNKDEWIDYFPPEPEPEEEVKVRVKYIPRPYNDEHFDLKNPNHIVGKALINGSYQLEGQFGINCNIMGLALFEKWEKLNEELRKSNGDVATCIAEKIKDIIGDIECAEKDAILLYLNNPSNIDDIDLISCFEEKVKNVIKEFEPTEIDNQIELYEHWKELREEEIDRSMKLFEKNRLIEEMEKKRAEIEAEEERIFFFEQESQWKIMIANKKQQVEDQDNAPMHPKFQWKQKKVRKDLGEEYIPPEVGKRRS